MGGGLVLVLLEEANKYQDKHKAPAPHHSTPCPYTRGEQGAGNALRLFEVRKAFMRAVDDSNPKYAAVIRELLIWKQLPESDLSRLVHHYFLITDDFRDMEDQGLLTMNFIGDEYVLSLTTYGRLWLEQYDAEHKQNEENEHAQP